MKNLTQNGPQILRLEEKTPRPEGSLLAIETKRDQVIITMQVPLPTLLTNNLSAPDEITEYFQFLEPVHDVYKPINYATNQYLVFTVNIPNVNKPIPSIIVEIKDDPLQLRDISEWKIGDITSVLSFYNYLNTFRVEHNIKFEQDTEINQIFIELVRMYVNYRLAVWFEGKSLLPLYQYEDIVTNSPAPNKIKQVGIDLYNTRISTLFNLYLILVFIKFDSAAIANHFTQEVYELSNIGRPDNINRRANDIFLRIMSIRHDISEILREINNINYLTPLPIVGLISRYLLNENVSSQHKEVIMQKIFQSLTANNQLVFDTIRHLNRLKTPTGENLFKITYGTIGTYNIELHMNIGNGITMSESIPNSNTSNSRDQNDSYHLQQLLVTILGKLVELDQSET